jgi:hypothetical protein
MKFKIGDKVRIVKCIWATNPRKEFGIGEVHTITRVNDWCSYPYVLDSYGDWSWRDEELELVKEDKIVITTDGKTTTATLYRDKDKVIAIARCSPEDEFDFMTGAKIAMERLEKELKPTPTKLKIELGKKYKLKSWDAVEDHHGITKTIWEKIVDYPVVAREKKGYATESWLCDTNFCELIFIPEVIEREWDDTKDGFYNGKVVCIKHGEGFTVGKIYNIQDGKFIDNHGSKRPVTDEVVRTLDDLKNNYFAKWANQFIPYVE